MVFQPDKDAPQDSFETGLPTAQSGEDVPRWLVILGLVAGFTLLVALLRYAVDLLGVVFVIILVGFAIRALSDWLTEGESVSGWAMSALSLGLMGTVLVGLWLFNSRDMASEAIQTRLPGPIQRTVSWLESQGWGQRVLLPGSSASGVLAGGSRPPAEPRAGGGAPPAADASDPREPVTMPGPSRSPAVGGAIAAVTRSRTAKPRPGSAPGEAEAAPTGQTAATATPAPVEPPVVVPTSITLTSSPARAVVGRSVRLTAHVRAMGADSAPTGTVVFSADDVVLGKAMVRSGTATLVTLDLGIGDHTLSAAYDGDDAHLPSRSASISQPVARK
jgi:Bacterial Ig-like domain (group 3)